MTEQEEQIYLQGEKAIYQRFLNECLRGLGGEELTKERMVSERAALVAQLRILCAEFGDNDWDDNNHLADVIEKHLGKYLYQEKNS